MNTFKQYMYIAFFWFWLVFGLALAVLSRGSYGTAAATISFASLFLIYGIWKLIQAVKRRDKWVKPVAVILYSGVLLQIGSANAKSITRTHEDNFKPLIAALESYKADKGRYPDRLNELVPLYITKLPKCPYDMRGSAADYYGLMTNVPKAGDQYTIQCVIGVFMYPQYAMHESDSTVGWLYY